MHLSISLVEVFVWDHSWSICGLSVIRWKSVTFNDESLLESILPLKRLDQSLCGLVLLLLRDELWDLLHLGRVNFLDDKVFRASAIDLVHRLVLFHKLCLQICIRICLDKLLIGLSVLPGLLEIELHQILATSVPSVVGVSQWTPYSSRLWHLKGLVQCKGVPEVRWKTISTGTWVVTLRFVMELDLSVTLVETDRSDAVVVLRHYWWLSWWVLIGSWVVLRVIIETHSFSSLFHR